RVEPGRGHRLLQDGQVVPGRRSGARFRDPARREVPAPFAGALGRAGPRPCARREAGQDLGEEPEVSILALDLLDRDVQRLWASHARALADLAADQTGLLEPAQVGPERVRVQGQAGRELADRDRPAREPQVAVEPEARVVGERLVDLERGGLTGGHGWLLAIDGTGARRRPRAPDVPWEKARFAPCRPG